MSNEPIRCFLLEPTGEAELWLRRYTFSSSGKTCPDYQYGHGASNYVERVPARRTEDDGWAAIPVTEYSGHERWPTTCERCGYEFTDDDQWQVNQEGIYRRVDDGTLYSIRMNPLGEGGVPVAPPGAMWFADWYARHFGHTGPDGRCLVCRVPGGNGLVHDWTVDGRANNCTKPDDKEHRCWVRHGEPPDVTIDKNGNTCDAGAGSIGVPGWHGFLREGHLVQA